MATGKLPLVGWALLKMDREILSLKVGEDKVLCFNWPPKGQDVLDEIVATVNEIPGKQFSIEGLDRDSRCDPGTYLEARLTRTA